MNGLKFRNFSFNFMKMSLKPMLAKKLKCKRVKWVQIYIDKLNDLIELKGFGEQNTVWQLVECAPLKLSEHEDWETAALTEAKKELPADHKQIDKCYIGINFEAGTCKSEIFFVNAAGNKQKMCFESKF